jgi:hypothetical protein
MCGIPLYEYHHMDGNPANNIGGNITLLCGTHHTEATNRLLTPEQVDLANANPINVQRGVSSPYGLHFDGGDFSCTIGGNTFSSRLRDEEQARCAIAVSVDDTDLIWFRIDRSGGLFLNANIFDENNLLLLAVHDNAMVYRATIWDIEFVGPTLTVREAARQIIFEIEFKPPNSVVIERARLLCNGVEISVRKSHLFVVNGDMLVVRCTVQNCDVGLQLGRNERRLSVAFSTPPEKLSRYMAVKHQRHRERQAIKKLKHFGMPLDFESPT